MQPSDSRPDIEQQAVTHEPAPTPNQAPAPPAPSAPETPQLPHTRSADADETPPPPYIAGEGVLGQTTPDVATGSTPVTRRDD